MSRILWLSNAAMFTEAVQAGTASGHITGGVAYNSMAFSMLGQRHEINTAKSFIRSENESLPVYGWRIAGMEAAADILIKDPMVLSFNKSKGKAGTIGVIHHIDYHKMRSSFRHWVYLSALERRMILPDRLILVSEFWRDYVRSKGAKDLRVIHNSFDINEFTKARDNQKDIFQLLGLPADRPLIYLGMASKEKGFDRMIRLVADLPYSFFATGEWQGTLPANTKVLRLNREEYLCMLNTATTTVTMPAIPEGWSRVAHESLLSHTPVIGIESGGMTELLEKSGQIIIRADSELAPALRRSIAEAASLGKAGFEYVKQFDLDYFRKAWLEAVEI
jgi:glycosyltransferase involved in cell wall biosynthesis